MIPRSAADLWTGSPTACSPTSTATGGGWPRVRRRVRRAAAVTLASATIAWSPGCGYLNTFYNAERAYEEGERLAAGSRDSVPEAARKAFERAAEKSGVLLTRYSDSRYADDALLLLGKSLFKLGRYADAGAAFRRYVERFPDGQQAFDARLWLVRSERLGGNLQAARVALSPLIEGGPDADLPADVLHEKALLDLATGAHVEAIAGFRTLLELNADYAHESRVALALAEAELAVGDYDSALRAYADLREVAIDPALHREIALRLAGALALADRPSEALSTYEQVLAGKLADSLAASIHARRAEILVTQAQWDEAERDFRRVAELVPGSALAAKATLHRGRIVWRERGRREEALEILLDAFLHAPTSAYGDSARSESRTLARLIHYERLASGEAIAIGDPRLVQATALYRLAEEVLDAEADPGSAAEIFAGLAERYPESPWRPRALLASGMLERSAGIGGGGEAALRALISEHPDTPESDSARRLLGDSLPDRPFDFYASEPRLAALAVALPDPEDPMTRITDQLDRYAQKRQRGEPDAEDLRALRRRQGGRGALRAPVEPETEDVRPGSPEGVESGPDIDDREPGPGAQP